MLDSVTSWMRDALQSTVDWLLSIYESVKAWILDTAYAVFDSVLSVFQSLIESIPVPDSWSIPSLWSAFNPQTQWILEHLQVTAVLAIIAAAWGIRFIINLVPSWLTRV